jgi:putative hemolysin
MESRIALTGRSDAIMGRIGSLVTRLAATRREIEAAEVIRYRVFVEEMGAELPVEPCAPGAITTLPMRSASPHRARHCDRR